MEVEEAAAAAENEEEEEDRRRPNDGATLMDSQRSISSSGTARRTEDRECGSTEMLCNGRRDVSVVAIFVDFCGALKSSQK